MSQTDFDRNNGAETPCQLLTAGTPRRNRRELSGDINSLTR